MNPFQILHWIVRRFLDWRYQKMERMKLVIPLTAERRHILNKDSSI